MAGAGATSQAQNEGQKTTRVRRFSHSWNILDIWSENRSLATCIEPMGDDLSATDSVEIVSIRRLTQDLGCVDWFCGDAIDSPDPINSERQHQK
jgi:hypothetical protein